MIGKQIHVTVSFASLFCLHLGPFVYEACYSIALGSFKPET